MRKLILLGLLIPSVAFGQQNAFVRNDDNASTLNGANGRQASASVDSKGVQSVKTVDGSGSGETQSVIPVSNAVNLNGVGALGVGYYYVDSDAAEAASTTTVINATSHVARVGDMLSLRSGTAGNIGVWSTVSAVTANTITLSNALPATPAAADSFYILRPAPFSVNNNLGAGGSTRNSLNVAIDSIGQSTAATGILKLEDAAAASGDALVGVAGVVNESLTSQAAAGDYTTITTDRAGIIVGAITQTGNLPTAFQPAKIEDSVAASGDAVFGIAGITRSALVNAAASGDYAVPVLDESSRTITTLAPAGETWSVCSSLVTDTSSYAIKAAVASNRVYTTSVTCYNNSATASEISLQDGSGGTSLFRGFVTANTTSGMVWNQTFPIPLRTTVGNGLFFTMITTGTSSRCCASGYISVN